MSPGASISAFVGRRFDELHELLNSRGLLLDFSGRERPRWEDDPPLGVIHQRAIYVPFADEDEDAEPDERITMTIVERWSDRSEPEAQEHQGHFLVTYSYHAQAGVAELRYELDPEKHPEMPYHMHPSDDPGYRLPSGPVQVSQALDALEQLIARERAAGRL